MQFLKRAWRGEEGLAKVFWLYGVGVLTLVLCAASGGLWVLKYNNRAYAEAARVVLLALEFAFLVWISVALWRCAGRAASPYLKKAARLYDVSVIFFLLWLLCAFTVSNFFPSAVGFDFNCTGGPPGRNDIEVSFAKNMCSVRVLNRY